MKQKTPKLPLNSFIDMLAALPDDKACREYLEEKLWNGTPTCTHCGTVDEKAMRLTVKGEFKGMYKCRSCRERFTVTLKTMFEGSHIGLRKWFIAIYIFSLHKKGVSSHQLASDLGITQKSAWFLLHRIRQAFGQEKTDTLGNVVEIDETFMGGESKNKHTSKKVKNERGGTMHTQQPVLGMRERDGNVIAIVVPNRNKETILPIILNTVEQDSTIMTDEYTAYKDLRLTHSHFTVNHGAKEYVNHMAHTNGIENFWSHLKRGVDGIYHWVSKEHLQSYVDEYTFRFNLRKLSVNDKFDFSLKNSTRLTYKELIAK
jgi:transposase-like protein